MAGLMADMSMNQIMLSFIGGTPAFPGGMATKNQVALSYMLLGTLAYGISSTGLAAKFADILEQAVGTNGKRFVLVLAVVACFSQNLIPIHIAFIPILIPPLLSLMNKLKVDRRSAACALVFGLKAPYMLIPVGFGLMFHGIVTDAMNNNVTEEMIANYVAANANHGLTEEMIANNMVVSTSQMWLPALLPTIGMVIGLFIAVLWSYNKERHYDDKPLIGVPIIDEKDKEGFTIRHWGALIGALTAFATQIGFTLYTGRPAAWSLPLGAAIGIVIMVITGAIRYKEFDNTVKGGIGLMGFIAFIMLVAGGYGGVMRATGAVDTLVAWALNLAGDNRFAAIVAMQLVGLLITMGIGTSFGTVPIIAIIFVPFCLAMGFSPMATAALIISAGVTGDAGTPASDSTLGPTAGLNADGQHDHIYDTCVPSFIHFNFPIMIFGTIAAMIL